MVTLGDKSPFSYSPAAAKPNSQEKKEGGQTNKVSHYEQSREKRIKQNLERMQKLGILDLSLKLKSLKPPAPPKSTHSSIRRTLRHSSPLSSPPGPTRRSSRLQNATPVSYSEVQLRKKDNPFENEHDLLGEEGSKPEIYTEKHKKLLGTTEMSWTLFVDGVGKDGKRIYDPVNGKTCHQCRQKTLGHRTHCSKCNKVQGQFCGDCLYMRYGEHVLEANKNPNWICPVCRGICNCSLCRTAKGWAPTGCLYRKISSLGFKSVAHYLIQTQHSNSDLETNSGTKVPTTVKRSLPFSGAGEISIEKESSELNVNPQGLEYPQSEGRMTDNCLDDGKQEERADFLNNKEDHIKVENNSELIMQPELATSCNTENALLLGKVGKETDLHVCSNIPCENGAESLNKVLLPKTSSDEKGAPESTPTSNKKHGHTTEPVADSIAGRLRQRRKTGNEHEEEMSTGAKDGTELMNVSSPCKAKATVNLSNSTSPDVTDGIAGRLRQRRNQGNQYEEQRSTGAKNSISDVKAEATPDVTHITCSNSNRKRVRISEPSPDSIAGRLRQRRAEVKAV